MKNLKDAGQSTKPAAKPATKPAMGRPAAAREREARKKSKGRWRLLVLCYAAALLCWLCFAGLRTARDAAHRRDGSMQQTELRLEDCESITGLIWEWGKPEVFISADADPQLGFAFEEGVYASGFRFIGSPANKGCGEMVMYYTTRPDSDFAEGEKEDFSEAKKVWAQLDAEGHWYFDLGGRTVYRLRFDPDNVGGVYWRVGGMTLNPPLNPAAVWIPDTLQAAVLLLLPLLGWGVLSEVIAFAHPIFTRRRFEKRWNELAPKEAEEPAK